MKNHFRLTAVFLVMSMLFSFCIPASATDVAENNMVTTVSALSTAQNLRLSNIISAETKRMNITFDSNVTPTISKPLRDFSGNLYTVIECEPTGYMILHNDSYQIVEYSTSSPSPYLGYSTNLYYGGPTEYYYLENESFVHTILDEQYSKTYMNSFSTVCDTANEYYKDTVDLATKEYIENGTPSSQIQDTLEPNSITTAAASPTYISNAPVFTHCATKSEMSYFGKGACGYIAAALLMLWYRQTVNTKYLDINNSSGVSYLSYKSDGYYVFNGDPENYYNGRTFSYNLWRWHSTMGHDDYENGDYSTGAGDIATTLTSYLSTKGLPCNYIVDLFPSTERIMSVIENNDRPYLLWGLLQPADESRGKCTHAVTVYGHYDGYLICHFGWPNYTCSSVKGIWASGLYLKQ